MKRIHSILAALAVLFSATPAAAQQDETRLAQFRAVCGEGRAPAQATLERARTQGWSETRSNAHPQLERAFLLTQALMPSMSPIFLTRAEAGRQSFMIVASASDLPSRVGCFVFDFDATARVDGAQVTAWLGQAASDERDLSDGGLYMARWDNPTAFPGILGIGATFVAPGSRAAENLGVTGTMLAQVSAP